LQSLSAEPQKLSKIFSTLFGKMKLHTGDVFLVWRMRMLAAEGKLEVMGEWEKGWKEISIKLAGIAEKCHAYQ